VPNAVECVVSISSSISHSRFAFERFGDGFGVVVVLCHWVNLLWCTHIHMRPDSAVPFRAVVDGGDTVREGLLGGAIYIS
jgi:hypothetical protein